MATINLVPVSCYECNKRLGLYDEPFEALLNEGINPEEALNKLDIVRQCCRKNIQQQMVVPFPPSAQEIEEELSKLTVRDKPKRLLPATASNVTVAAPITTGRVKQLPVVRETALQPLGTMVAPERNVEYRQYYLTYNTTGNPLLWEKKSASGALERRAVQYQNIQGLEGKTQKEIEREYETTQTAKVVPMRKSPLKSPPKAKRPPRKVVRK